MAKWLLSTVEKKNVETITYWERDEMEISLTERFRWGSIIIRTKGDDAPDIDLKNDNGFEIASVLEIASVKNTEINDIDDQYSGDWDFDDNDVDEEAIEEGWEESGFEYMEEENWNTTRSEIWFFGPLELKRMEE